MLQKFIASKNKGKSKQIYSGGKEILDSSEFEAIDLISLLTAPGMEGVYEAEHSLDAKDLEDDNPEMEEKELKKAEKVTSKEKQKTNTKAEIVESVQEASKSELAKTKRNIFKEQIKKTVENDSLEKIAQEVATCENCELCKNRNKTVPGAGSINARLVFVGEAPGADEDKTGIPFVGKAGKHLDKILKAAGFSRDEVFICNILKCRPPGNRNPNLPEMMACTPFLRRQLDLIKPDLIACLGNTAIKYIIGPRTPGITRIHGEWFESIFKIPTMAMYHPSYLIRNESRAKGSPNWQMWQDIQKLKKRYDSILAKE